MKQELDNRLCNDYPRIFADRYKDMKETCMCWGFECDDGWYNIIDALCSNIQSHLDHLENQRSAIIKYNQMVQAGLDGDLTALRERYETWTDPDKQIQESLSRGLTPVPDPVPQVVAEQVKEKYGTLRFYYRGGDDVVDGMVRMAEAMTDRTCEVCGAPGIQCGGGWIKTLCEQHAEERGIYTKERF